MLAEPRPSGLSSTMRQRDAANLDAAAALQLAERVLSRHAQMNPTFQHAPGGPDEAIAQPDLRRASKSCGTPGMLGILQADPALARASRGLDALDVQGPSRQSSHRKPSSGSGAYRSMSR